MIAARLPFFTLLAVCLSGVSITERVIVRVRSGLMHADRDVFIEMRDIAAEQDIAPDRDNVDPASTCETSHASPARPLSQPPVPRANMLYIVLAVTTQAARSLRVCCAFS